jgi:GNAT superfamily N-acetyltransferase
MIKIEKAGIEQAPIVFDLVDRLLKELREEGEEFSGVNRDRILKDWQNDPDRFAAFISRDDHNKPVGVITLVCCFALYAEGEFGIINELYVIPEFRSQKVGSRLLDAAKTYAREKGWKRIDVTAPSGKKWERTVKFYEREGFKFTGPKLKFMIS